MHKVTLARCYLNIYLSVSRLHAQLALASSAHFVHAMSTKLLGFTGPTMSQQEVVMRVLLQSVFDGLRLAPNIGQALYNEAFPQSEAGLEWDRKVWVLTPLKESRFLVTLCWKVKGSCLLRVPICMPTLFVRYFSLVIRFQVGLSCYTGTQACKSIFPLLLNVVLCAGTFYVHNTDNTEVRTVHFASATEVQAGSPGVSCDEGNCHIVLEGEVCRHVIVVASAVALAASVLHPHSGLMETSNLLQTALKQTRWFHTRGGRSLVVASEL